MSAGNFETAQRALLALEQDLRSPSVRWDSVAHGLVAMGNYLTQVKPSSIDKQFVSQIEYFLDQLLHQLEQQSITQPLHDAIRRSLELATSVNASFAEQRFDPEFVHKIKYLGQGLTQIGESLGEQRNLAGDPTTPPPPPEKKKKKGQEK